MAIERPKTSSKVNFLRFFHNGFVSPLLANSLLAVRICGLKLILLVVELSRGFPADGVDPRFFLG